MKQIKHSYMMVVAMALAGVSGLQVAQAADIVASNIVSGATFYTTGDGLVTLTPYATVTNSVVGNFGATANLFGVQGGVNSEALDDVDGNPFTTYDREAIGMDFDGTVGLSQIGFVWARADGSTVSNGVSSGVEISGFTEDPGIWSEAGPIISTYTNGVVYFSLYNWSADPLVFKFASADASKGQELRMSVNDFDQAGPRLSIDSLSYDTEGFEPPPPPTNIILAADIANGATNHITGDGLVTLTPLAAGLTNGGAFGSNELSLFGVQGGVNPNALDDADGNPFTTYDREAIDMEFDGTVGLSQIAFVWARADGTTVSNGVRSGVEISGFTEDPGVWSEIGTINSMYTNGTVYFDLYNWSGTPRAFKFASTDASTGQVLRISVNDFDQAGPRLSINSISYDTEGFEPPPPPPDPHPPIGTIVASNLVEGTFSYTTGDGLVSLTPYATVTNSIVGTFGLAPNGISWFGIQDLGNERAINDLDGNPFTTYDREALDITLDASVAISEIGFIWSRANGPVSNGVPSGIVISGFLEDPVIETDTTVVSTYTNGAVYLSYSYDYGTERKFNFQNLGASAGQVLRLSANDFDEANAQVAVTFIAYAESPTAQSAVLSIQSVSGQVSVTATNMSTYANNTLQGTMSLIAASWDDIASTTGVEQVTWPVSDSEPIQFFRVESE